MNDALIWLAAAGVLVILEIFTGTFYLLMLAVGMLAGALAAWLGASNPQQMLAVAIVGIAACLVLYKRRVGRSAGRDAANDPNINLDIGQSLRVDEWRGSAPGPWTARVHYRGAQWDIELEKGREPLPGLYVIRQVRGSRLLVEPA